MTLTHLHSGVNRV